MQHLSLGLRAANASGPVEILLGRRRYRYKGRIPALQIGSASSFGERAGMWRL